MSRLVIDPYNHNSFVLVKPELVAEEKIEAFLPDDALKQTGYIPVSSRVKVANKTISVFDHIYGEPFQLQNDFGEIIFEGKTE